MISIRKRNNVSKGSALVILSALIFAFAGCGGGGRPGNVLDPAVTADNTLTAAKVAADPTIDGVANDAVWSSASAINVPLGDGMGEEPDCTRCHALNSQTTMSLKAVYTAAGKISILAKWSDSDASFTRGSSWTYDATDADGNAWTKTPSSGQNEDRIAFFWPIGSISGTTYNTGGCMTKCHTSDTDADGKLKEDEVFLANGRADLWHGKAARAVGAISGSQSGNLVIATTHEVTAGSLTLNGYMHDTNVLNLADMAVAGLYDGVDHGNGRASDEGTVPYSNNKIGDSSRPKYMETNPTDFIDAMFLTQAEINAGETVGSAAAGVTEADAAANWPKYSALKAIVPEIILGTPTLSGSDIRHACAWSNGWWTCEIQRDLQTTTGAGATNADDVQFDATEEYVFGVAIMDNGDGIGVDTGHKTSDKYTLKFAQ